MMDRGSKVIASSRLHQRDRIQEELGWHAGARFELNGTHVLPVYSGEAAERNGQRLQRDLGRVRATCTVKQVVAEERTLARSDSGRIDVGVGCLSGRNRPATCGTVQHTHNEIKEVPGSDRSVA